MKHLSFLLTGLAAISLTSCSLLDLFGGSDDSDINYLAVQVAGSERWSIVDTKTGEIVADGEFKNEPSSITEDGYFYVRNSNDTYDYYNVKDINHTLNSEPFLDVTYFGNSDVTPVVKEGQAITLVDKSMKVIATLDTSIRECTVFQDGYALVVTEEGKYGYINKKGEYLIKPKYDLATLFSDGVAFVANRQDDSDTFTVHAIDTDGKDLFKFGNDKYDRISQEYVNGYMAVVSNGKLVFLDKKGEKALSCGEFDGYSYILSQCQFDGKYFIYCNDEELFGLKDKNGEVVLRPKYSSLVSIGDDKYIASREDKYGVIDSKDEKVLQFDYDGISFLRNNTLLVQEGKNQTLIDFEGKEIGKEDFRDAALHYKSYSVMSNYLDINEFVNNMLASFTSDSFEGFSKGISARGMSYYLGSPENYRWTSSASIEKDGKNVELYFDSYISRDEGPYYYYDWQFNPYAYLTSAHESFSMNGRANLYSKIEKAFGDALKNQGYTEQGDNSYTSPDGNTVSISQDYGSVRLSYRFSNAYEEAAAEVPESYYW